MKLNKLDKEEHRKRCEICKYLKELGLCSNNYDQYCLIYFKHNYNIVYKDGYIAKRIRGYNNGLQIWIRTYK